MFVGFLQLNNMEIHMLECDWPEHRKEQKDAECAGTSDIGERPRQRVLRFRSILAFDEGAPCRRGSEQHTNASETSTDTKRIGHRDTEMQTVANSESGSTQETGVSGASDWYSRNDK